MVMYIADPVLPLGFLLVSTLVGLIPARTPSYCILVCILCILYIVLYIVTKLVGLITARTPLILSNVLSIVLYIVTTLVFRIPARTLIISVIHRRCEGITRHASQNTWCGSISAHHLYFFNVSIPKRQKQRQFAGLGEHTWVGSRRIEEHLEKRSGMSSVFRWGQRPTPAAIQCITDLYAFISE